MMIPRNHNNKARNRYPNAYVTLIIVLQIYLSCFGTKGLFDRLFPGSPPPMSTILPTTKQLEQEETMPKIIWTYWNDDDEIPIIVKLCSWSWQILNPDWEFRFLDTTTVTNFVPRFKEYQQAAESPARLSDFIRLSLLNDYGGVWTDSSNLPLTPLETWLVQGQIRTGTDNNYDHVTTVFQLEGWSHRGSRTPLIESWFIASWPGSPLIQYWRHHFERIVDIGVDAMVEENKHHGVDFQGINAPEYLAIHVAAQRAIQDNNDLMNNVVVLVAEDGPYRSLQQNFAWDTPKFCQNYLVPNLQLSKPLIERITKAPLMLSESYMELARNLVDSFQTKFDKDAFIKLRGWERKCCEPFIQEMLN